MGKYKFELNALLKLQKNKEQVIQKELGQAYKVRDSIVEQQKQLQQRQNQIINDLSSYEQQRLEVREVAGLYQYSNHLKVEQNKISLKLVDSEQQIAKVKTNLADAVKEKKILENLRKRSYDQWLKEEKEAEQKVVDELISYKYSSK